MLWTDIQQNMYSTNNLFNNNNNNLTSNNFQPATFKQNSYMNPLSYNNSVRTGSMSSSTEEDDDAIIRRTNSKRKASFSVDQDNNDEKRKNFLERNRQGIKM
jgi:hypothetical protein